MVGGQEIIVYEQNRKIESSLNFQFSFPLLYDGNMQIQGWISPFMAEAQQGFNITAIMQYSPHAKSWLSHY